MRRPEDAGKYGVENQQVVQGQAIGDHVSVDNYSGPRRRPPSSPTPPPERLWTIPFQRNPFFLGQEDLLNQLHRRLTRGTPLAMRQTQAISGLGGIGKTQIAIEYAYRHQESYAFVFWIRAEHRETLVADLMNLASLLQLPEQYETDQMKVVAAVKRWLVGHPGWLLIFDNADDLPLLSPFLPQQHAGAILLTTRASQTHPLAELLLVEQMDERVGADFLLHRARLLVAGQALEEAAPADQRAARRLCQLLGGLPLALDQAGAYIDETQCRVQDYLNFYLQDRQVRAKLLQRRGKATAGHPQPVATTWALAFARMEQASPAAADMLRACAFLAPDLIPEDLLRQGARWWGPALESVANSPFQWNETIGELLKYGLLRRSREHQALSMHQLVQTALKDAMDGPTRQLWIEHTIQAVEHAFPGGTEPANWPICKRLLPHARICAALIEEQNLRSREGANLLQRMANYLREHARYSEAEPLLQRVVRIWEQRLGPEHPQQAYALNDLALLYVEQGKYGQAEPLLERVVHIWEQLLGPQHPEVVYPLNSLADLYYYQGNYEQAEPLYQRILRMREQQLRREHPQEAYALYNLADLYYYQGNYEQAEPLYQQALRMREQQLGPEHPLVAYPLNSLANLYYHQGNYEQAEPLYQRALGIWEQLLGPEHPEVAYVLYSLADLYYHQGNYEQAEPLYQRTLRIREQRLGPEHPLVTYPLYNLALLYTKQDRYELAEPLYQRALRIREQRLGPEHPFTQTARRNYASLLRVMGREVEAKKLEEGG